MATLPARASDVSDAACMANVASSLNALARGDYVGAAAHFNATLLRLHDAPGLARTWAKIQQMDGAYQARSTPQWQVIDGDRYLITQLTFVRQPFDAIHQCDAAGAIDYAEWGPASDAAVRIASAKPRVDDNGVHEVPLAVPSPFGPLPGTLLVPAGKGPFAAVLLVVGSGPQDGDETIGPNKPFRDLAEGLAARGVASFRYDKRSHAYRLKAALSKAFTVDEEVTDDALAALALLGRQVDVDPRRLFVLGHSLGGMMAPRIGDRDRRLAGLVLLAAPARSLLDVSAQQVREQGKRNGASEAQIAAGEKAIADEQTFLAQAGSHTTPSGSFGGVPQSYWLSLHGYDQVAVAKTLPMPLLLLQGAGDFQVSPDADFSRWQQALAGRKNVAFHLYPGLSHLFMRAGPTGTIRDYDAPGHVDSQAIRDIADWIKGQPKR